MNKKRNFEEYVNHKNSNNEEFDFLNYTLGTHSDTMESEYPSLLNKNNTIPFSLETPGVTYWILMPNTYFNQGCRITVTPTNNPNINECKLHLFYKSEFKIKEIKFEDEFSFLSNEPIDINALVHNFFALVYQFEKRKPLTSKKYIRAGDDILNNIELIKQKQKPTDLRLILGNNYNHFMDRLAGKPNFFQKLDTFMLGDDEY